LKPVKEIKRVQVAGRKYFVPAEDAEIEKLIKRGLSLKAKMDTTKRELEVIHDRLIEIAQARREGTTTVTLAGISAQAMVTFRESFVVSDKIEDIAVPLGPLFARFFDKKTEFKATADFKKFMESGHALGLKDTDGIKEAIRKYVSVKETKPNIKMEVMA
jgi:hypothetical protein